MTRAGRSISSTHRIVFDGDRVFKTYRTWERGEPQREWRGLNLLHEHAPGLGPAPLEARFVSQPPSIVMSLVPGEPLGPAPLTPAQLDALAAALDRVHHSIPEKTLADAEPQDDPARFDALLQRMLLEQAEASVGTQPLVRRAVTAAAGFLDTPWVRLCAAIGTPSPAFCLNDGNLANYLWDGTSVRVVDLENAGRLDRAFDLADFVEHISPRSDAGMRPEDLLNRIALRADERERVRAYRPAFAVFWLLRLLPGGGAARRNPPGTLERQATHVLSLIDP